VRHCRVRKEGRLYSIGESEFESLVALIENYETAPLYKNTRLTDPIDSTRRDRPILHNQESRTCRTLYEYSAQHPDELSFAANVIISNVQKREENWWSGDFGGMEGGWFPKNYAEEVDTKRAQVILAEQTAVANTLDAAAMDVDGLHVEPRPSKPHQRLIFRIVNHKQNQFLDVGADDEDQMKLWAKLIDETATKYSPPFLRRSVLMTVSLVPAVLLTDAALPVLPTSFSRYNEQSQSVEVLQRKMKIAKELSDLVYYCYSVPFRDFDTSKSVPYNAMSSWNEKKAAAVCAQRGLNANPKGFNAYNQRQISRVYPQGRRLDSSNFDPQQMWNCGIQLVSPPHAPPLSIFTAILFYLGVQLLIMCMVLCRAAQVALNFQTPGAPMWLNNGKFRQNGNCGYLLKPAVLVDPAIPFNPHSPSTFRPHVDPLTLTVTILSARHLKKTKKKAGGKSGGKGRLVSPFVELELAGVPSDARRYARHCLPRPRPCCANSVLFFFVPDTSLTVQHRAV
jgi:phosphatidylinositol phospholipase C gamma-1